MDESKLLPSTMALSLAELMKVLCSEGDVLVTDVVLKLLFEGGAKPLRALDALRIREKEIYKLYAVCCGGNAVQLHNLLVEAMGSPFHNLEQLQLMFKGFLDKGELIEIDKE